MDSERDTTRKEHCELDIYTLDPLACPSKEHVIHNFLGGRLQPQLLNKPLNDRFGRTIDSELFAALQPILVSLDLRSNSKKATSPRATTIRPDNDERTWKLRPGGELDLCEITHHVAVTDASESNVCLEVAIEGGEALTIPHAVDLVWKNLVRNPQIDDSLKDRLLKSEKNVRRQIMDTLAPHWERSEKTIEYSIRMPLFSVECLRAIAKIACNFFAHHNRSLYYLSSFDRSRAFVLNGDGDPPVRLHFPPPPNVGSFSHSVVFSIQDNGDVVGLVTLFGKLSFTVLIGTVRDCDKPAIVRRQACYKVDQAGQTDSHDENIKIDLPPFNTSVSLDESIRRFAPIQQREFIFISQVASLTRAMSMMGENSDTEQQKLLHAEVGRLVSNLRRNRVIVQRENPCQIPRWKRSRRRRRQPNLR